MIGEKRGNPALFIFFLCLSAALIAFSLNFQQPARKFEHVITSSIEPALRVFVSISDMMLNFSEWLDLHVDTVEENKELKNKVKDLYLLQLEYEKLMNENSQLRQHLSMTKDYAGDPISTRIITDGSSPFARTVLIRAGHDKGVMRGQTVMNEYGLVGRVVDVFDDSARVMLATDYTFRVPIKVIGSHVQGLARGTNSGDLEIVIMEETDFVPPDGGRVVTSGVAQVFEEGIPVGVIRHDGDRYYIEPYVDFGRLDVLTVKRREIKGIIHEFNPDS